MTLVDKAKEIKKRLKKLDTGKTCVWFWESWIDTWQFYIVCRKDFFDFLRKNEEIVIEEIKKKINSKIVVFWGYKDYESLFISDLHWESKKVKEDDDEVSGSLRMGFDNVVYITTTKEESPEKISRKIQSILTGIVSRKFSNKEDFSDATSQSSPLNEAELSKEENASKQSLDSEDEGSKTVNSDDGQITQSQEIGNSLMDTDESLKVSSQEHKISGSDGVTNSNKIGEAEGSNGEREKKTPTSASNSEETKNRPGEECQSKSSGADKDEVDPTAEGNGFSSSQNREQNFQPSVAIESGIEDLRRGTEPTTGRRSSSGSLWEIEFNPEEDQHSYGGGGGQAEALSSNDSDKLIERKATLLLRQLFSNIEDIFKKEEGREHWDAKKVIYNIVLSPQNLPKSKFSRPISRKISLWVDVSGSVSYLSNVIISLITSACKDKDVQVVIGSEAHPQKVLPDKFYKTGDNWENTKPVWEHDYVPIFEEQCRVFFEQNTIEKGSTIVIWSDYMDINARNLTQLKKLFKPYRIVWLCSHDKEKDTNYCGNESFKLEKFAKENSQLFLWGIDGPRGIAKALKYLNIKKYRR